MTLGLLFFDYLLLYLLLLLLFLQDNIIVVKDDINHPMSVVSSTKCRSVKKVKHMRIIAFLQNHSEAWTVHLLVQISSSAWRWACVGLPESASHRLHPKVPALHQHFWIEHPLRELEFNCHKFLFRLFYCA